MHISVFDIFKIGIGPSSSHTVGPMRAARRFAERLEADGQLAATTGVKVELFGSLGFTGKGHASDRAILMGLEGEEPATVELDSMDRRVAEARATKRIKLLGKHEVDLDIDTALIFHRREKLPLHSNGMRFTAIGPNVERIYYSVGGGFVVDQTGAPADGSTPADQVKVPYPFSSGDELLKLAVEHGMAISSLMLENEKALAPEAEVKQRVRAIWSAMEASVERGCEREGILPGGLKVKRRAASLHRRLKGVAPGDPLVIMDWVNLFALAVNEENAAGGRVVTAPTNGAAGIIPAVVMYYRRFLPNADDEGTLRFLLTAAAIGALYKKNASISGAEVGCQGGQRRVLDGRRRARRGDGWDARAGRERGRDRHGAQPRPHVRSDRRARPGAVHRAQRDGSGEGDQRRASGAPGRRHAQGVPRQGDQDDVAHRRRHEQQVQGDGARRPRGEHHRVLIGYR